MIALILTNGDYGDYSFCKSASFYDYIVCADNGMRHSRKLGIVPHLIVGDLDSCNREDLQYYELSGVPILKVPSEKDETDTELAIEKAIEKGATSVDVYGGVGSRMDHSIANIQLLYKYLKKGIQVTLHSPNNKISLIKDCISLYGEKGSIVSLMPFTEKVTGVTTQGLAYGLEEGVFQLGDAFGVSNYMLGTKAQVTIKKGLLLVFQTID